MFNSIDWTLLITAFLGSGIGAALVNLLALYLKEKRNYKRTKRHLAHVLAAHLESYAIRAYENMEGSELYFDTGGREGKEIEFPDYEGLVLSQEYKFVSDDVRDAVLSFHDRITIEQVKFRKRIVDVDHPFPANEEAWAAIRTLAGDALLTAQSIRKLSKLPEKNIPVGGDIKLSDYLSKEN